MLFGQSVGRYALLRVPRPLRGLLLDLDKAHHTTDFFRAFGTLAGGESKVACIGYGANGCALLAAELLTQTELGAVIGLCDRASG